MTDSIDLDDIETDTEAEEDRPNRGDWFWRGEGDPEDEPATRRADDATADGTAGSADDTDADRDATDGAADPTGVPRVPREGDDRPVGIPKEQGGGGSAPAGAEPTPSGGVPDADADATGSPGVPESDAGSGSDPGTANDADRATTGAAPHGESADDMTMAVTYRAAKRLADPAAVFADASAWADWVGIVGRVDTHVINKFQREHRIDADFFSGTGTGPGERLAEVDRTSMFYADRMVVVGVAGEDERVAAEADWEFVPLAEAAEKAGWDLVDG